MNRFQKSVAEVLEVPEIGLDDGFRSVPGWCSLKAFGLLVTLENDWGAPVTAAELEKMRTVRDLYRAAFRSFAAGIFGIAREKLPEDAAYGTIPQWDSVNHLRLTMEAERRFGVRFELERIPSLRRLDDFLV